MNIDQALGIDVWAAEDVLKRGIPLTHIDLMKMRGALDADRYRAIISLAATAFLNYSDQQRSVTNANDQDQDRERGVPRR